jgi:anaerobic ribonucleoside-triphosphate reductase activating protein
VIRVATIVDSTEAEGPGHRLALWVQGCTIRCPGCCNPEMFVADGGTARSIDEVSAHIAGVPGIEGISILGGEPFEQAEAVAELARRTRERGLTVMVYSGYTLAELHEQARERPAVQALIDATDLLVDGRYDRDRPEPAPPIGRRWLGSTNQVMHYLSAAYAPDDPRLREANTVEVHWQNGKLIVNGWPSGAAALVQVRRR